MKALIGRLFCVNTNWTKPKVHRIRPEQKINVNMPLVFGESQQHSAETHCCPGGGNKKRIEPRGTRERRERYIILIHSGQIFTPGDLPNHIKVMLIRSTGDPRSLWWADLQSYRLSVNKGWIWVIHLAAPRSTVHHGGFHVRRFIAVFNWCCVILLIRTRAATGEDSARRSHKFRSLRQKPDMRTTLLAGDVEGAKCKWRIPISHAIKILAIKFSFLLHWSLYMTIYSIWWCVDSSFKSWSFNQRRSESRSAAETPQCFHPICQS